MCMRTSDQGTKLMSSIQKQPHPEGVACEITEYTIVGVVLLLLPNLFCEYLSIYLRISEMEPEEVAVSSKNSIDYSSVTSLHHVSIQQINLRESAYMFILRPFQGSLLKIMNYCAEKTRQIRVE